jgi:formylglycine-generating enzyme required for sulfatase activity
MARASKLFFGWVLLALAGCTEDDSSLPPFGEVVVEIDTDLAVPSTINRVRIDLFASDRTWLESRDFATLGAGDFPLSFSVYNESPSEPREMLVRVRGYAEGRVRDYQGERFEPRPTFSEPPHAASLGEACASAQTLELGKAGTGRFRAQLFADGSIACGPSAASGLAVFRVEIPVSGEYRLEVVAANPEFEWFASADTLMSIRRVCDQVASEVACNDDIDGSLGVLSGMTQTLEAGSHFVLVGNRHPGPMDVTLLVARADLFGAEPTPQPELPAPDAPPRLILEGRDITPAREPLPSRTVDRLALIRIEPERQRTARLLLAGWCVGTMADLAGEQTCIGAENERTALSPEPLLEGRLHGGTSALVGSWPGYAEKPCSGAPKAGSQQDGIELFDEQVCVPGGSFVLGDTAVLGRPEDAGQPERLAIVPPFFMDRYEYTVGRYRAARKRGFEAADGGPFNRLIDDLELHPQAANKACTYSELLDLSTVFPEQESLPLSCISWRTARAACQFEGGDLPTVAQREYAASASHPGAETFYPWGDERPDCERAAWGRWIDPARGSIECTTTRPDLGSGPVAVDALPWADNDRTPEPTRIVGLGGSLAEWTLDSHRGYLDACWVSQSLTAPRCWEEEAPLRSLMGASWRDAAGRARAANRVRGAVFAVSDSAVGFRCVYPAEGS